MFIQNTHYDTVSRCEYEKASYYADDFGRGLFMNTKWNTGRDGSHNLSLLNQNNKYGILKKVLFAAVLLLTVSFNLAFANEGNIESIDKIYHVYLEDEYIGSVSDEEQSEKNY